MIVQDLSDVVHEVDGVHDPEYDHDAFLGKTLAAESKKQSPETSRNMLRYFVYSFIHSIKGAGGE